MSLYSIITSCRSCGSTDLTTILDLGNHCISNFISKDDPEPQAPLELVQCSDCSLVQLKHTVNRNHLYYNQYWYKSGINESMVASLKNVVEDAMCKVSLLPGDAICDIGCNDGTLLSFYPDHIHKHGFEPNLTLAGIALKNAEVIIGDYFPSHKWTPAHKYKVITSIAQLYNTDHLNEYVNAVKHILHPEGIWIVQMQDLEGMLKSNAIDNVCHEHVTYFSTNSFLHLINKHNMVISSVSYNQVNGGSVRFTVKHGDLSHYTLKQPIDYDLNTFKSNVLRLKSDTVDLLHKLKAGGKTVLGVAASTKANTLLQFYNITPDLLPAIAERSVEKIGKLTVGAHIPIISEDDLQSLNPDYLLALAWHFADNFKMRYNWFHGQWIVPLPELTIGGTPCRSTQEELSGSV